MNSSFKIQRFLPILCLLALSVGCAGNSHNPAHVSIESPRKLTYNGPYRLKSEFDLCPYWGESMTWNDFQDIRTQMKHPGLMKYVNKIEANQMLRKKGIPVVPTLYASNKKENFLPFIKNLSSYVAKPAHMSANHGLTIVDNGIDLITGNAITPEEVQERMHQVLDTPSNSNEWLLQNMPRGFVVQEFIRGRQEFKFQTIWGKAVLGTWLQGNSMKYQFYDIDGNSVEDSGEQLPLKDAWKKAAKLAEVVAEGTDALRVDILVRLNGHGEPELMVNEMELRQQLGWVNHEEMFARKISDGYRDRCQPI